MQQDNTQSDNSALVRIVEGALLAAGRPLSLDQLQALFAEDERPDRADLRRAVATLCEDYAGRGMEIREVASGFRVQVCADLATWVSRLWEERPTRYSRALLETLALIAYRQPITRGEIEDIRGVSVSTNIMRTLQDRGWARIVGHRDVPGRPAMYGTTREFLDYFGLKSLDELPTLAELRDIDSINVELDLDGKAADVAQAPPEAVESNNAALVDTAEEPATGDQHSTSADGPEIGSSEESETHEQARDDTAGEEEARLDNETSSGDGTGAEGGDREAQEGGGEIADDAQRPTEGGA
jgi:segregation and condensation protein B